MSEISKSNTYLSFILGDEEFAIHVNNVLSILEYEKLTQIPKVPEFMKGVINVRGAVLPVIDTGLKIGKDPVKISQNTSIVIVTVVVENCSAQIGIMVDCVVAVTEFDNKQIQSIPDLAGRLKSEFVDGVANIDEKFVLILNLDSILSEKDLNRMLEETNSIESDQENPKEKSSKVKSKKTGK